MMIDEAHDAKHWDKAARIARAEEMRVVQASLKAQYRIIHIKKLILYSQLLVVKFKRIFRWLLIYKPRMMLIKLRILRLKISYFSLDCRLFILELYYKFTAHVRLSFGKQDTPLRK